jgi:hypothetical protein
MIFDRLVVCFVLISIHFFAQQQCASIDLVRYHSHIYRCGETIVDEDLIRPLYWYFVHMGSIERRTTRILDSVLHAIQQIEVACRTAYLTTETEMKSPSIIYSIYKWFR